MVEFALIWEKKMSAPPLPFPESSSIAHFPFLAGIGVVLPRETAYLLLKFQKAHTGSTSCSGRPCK